VGTVRFGVTFDAGNPGKRKADKGKNDRWRNNDIPPHQERCYSASHHVVAAWITAVASVVPSAHDFAFVRARYLPGGPYFAVGSA
jgi:hypothetical protein